ncbi:MAG: YdcF family protein [Pseudomonadota bacterium]
MRLVLTDPLFLCGLGVLVGLLLRPWLRRLGTFVAAAALVVLYGLSTPLVSAYLSAAVGDGIPLVRPAAEDGAGAIVVLGGDIRTRTPEYAGDTVGRLTLERLRYGARLQRETGLPLLVTGGPIGQSIISLSEAMRATLEDEFKVPVRWVDDKARSTFENARFAAELLGDEGIERIYLVTHAVHMPRAVEAFSYWGLDVVPAPTVLTIIGEGSTIYDFLPSTRALLASRYAIYEGIARYWYRYRFY